MEKYISGTSVRENIEWISIRWHDAPDNRKNRILLVGDSIVVGHGTKVHELLKEKICVDYFATSKHITDTVFMDELKFMLSKNDYELILFNNGLHGFEIDDDLYKPALRETLSVLKQQTPRLIWRSSTPILDKKNLKEFDIVKNPRVIRRNNDAIQVANELDIEILDLYTPMAENKDFFCEDGVHYTEDGQHKQAFIITDYFRQAGK